eukprot:gene3197-biopygen11898
MLTGHNPECSLGDYDITCIAFRSNEATGTNTAIDPRPVTTNKVLETRTRSTELFAATVVAAEAALVALGAPIEQCALVAGIARPVSKITVLDATALPLWIALNVLLILVCALDVDSTFRGAVFLHSCFL